MLCGVIPRLSGATHTRTTKQEPRLCCTAVPPLPTTSRQVEAFWEDSFTGIAYCRARWLVRASEVPGGVGEGDIPEGEVLLTTVANDIEAANILDLAPVKTKPKPEPETETETKPEPEPEAAPAAVGTRRGLRPKVRGRSRPGLGSRGRGKRFRGAATLYLSRSFDPFSEDLDLAVLPNDHPVLVRLRERERAESGGGGGGGGGTGRERGRGRLAHVTRDSPRKRWDVTGRAGVERKGLRGARLAVAPRRQRSNSTSSRSSDASTSSGIGGGGGGGGGGYSSTSSVSVSVGGDSDNSSSISNGGFTSEDSQDDLLDDEEVVHTSYPRTRGGRRGRRPAAGSSSSTSSPSAAAAATAQSNKTEPVPARSPAAPQMEPATSPPVSVSEAAVRAAALPARPRRLAMPPDDITLVSASGSSSGNTSSGSSSSSSSSGSSGSSGSSVLGSAADCCVLRISAYAEKLSLAYQLGGSSTALRITRAISMFVNKLLLATAFLRVACGHSEEQYIRCGVPPH